MVLSLDERASRTFQDMALTGETSLLTWHRKVFDAQAKRPADDREFTFPKFSIDRIHWHDAQIDGMSLTGGHMRC